MEYNLNYPYQILSSQMITKRFQDLGRLQEKLHKLLDEELLEDANLNSQDFYEKYNYHKDMAEVHSSLNRIRESLLDCWAIACNDE